MNEDIGLKGDQVLKCPMAFGPKVPMEVLRNSDLDLPLPTVPRRSQRLHMRIHGLAEHIVYFNSTKIYLVEVNSEGKTSCRRERYAWYQPL